MIELLDLPNEVIEKVLTFLPVAEVYSNVRNACRRLRDIGDGYVQAGKHTRWNI